MRDPQKVIDKGNAAAARFAELRLARIDGDPVAERRDELLDQHAQSRAVTAALCKKRDTFTLVPTWMFKNPIISTIAIASGIIAFRFFWWIAFDPDGRMVSPLFRQMIDSFAR